ncbi:MAG: hypothetical protein JW892_07525 [Anaerolineae bacterium]|nr:hypothetical protein [Anaerolineae bacterium]
MQEILGRFEIDPAANLECHRDICTCSIRIMFKYTVRIAIVNDFLAGRGRGFALPRKIASGEGCVLVLGQKPGDYHANAFPLIDFCDGAKLHHKNQMGVFQMS